MLDNTVMGTTAAARERAACGATWLQDVASSSHTSGSSGSLPPSLLPCFLHEQHRNREVRGMHHWKKKKNEAGCVFPPGSALILGGNSNEPAWCAGTMQPAQQYSSYRTLHFTCLVPMPWGQSFILPWIGPCQFSERKKPAKASDSPGTALSPDSGCAAFPCREAE